MTRMIIEGMDRDRIKLGYVIRLEDIATDINVIKTTFARYTFNLVGLMNEKGGSIRESLEGDIAQEIDYIPFGTPESPQTIILEDGRIFSWAREDRLEAVLKDFKSAGGFERVYEQIQENPGKFYS